MNKTRVETKVGRQALSLETGHMAKQADGSVIVQYGDTVVLVAAVADTPWRPMDFFPLRVDYREMTYAAGKFPGGFWKREGRPTPKETLTCRMMDRPIRPLFPDDYSDETIITGIVLSADRENDPDILSMIGTSAALMIAPNIPFLGPTGTVRIGKVDGEFILNPTYAELEESTMNLVVSGTDKAVTMIEGMGTEISEDELVEAVVLSQQAIREIVRIQNEMASSLGIERPVSTPPVESPLFPVIEAKYFDRIIEATKVQGKFKRRDAIAGVRADIVTEHARPDDAEGPTESDIKSLFGKLEKKACRTLIMQGTREDGRGLTDVRDVSCEVGVLPRVHGSALFTRGETQALVTCTLGTSIDEQRVDGLEDEYRKKFMLHYNFPPFCVGEARPVRGPSRREYGHGHLAEISLKTVLPPVENFPYTVRVVSDILESNGSSSMASVCGGTLCMMDAGVPLRQPVAGVAMGMVVEGDEVRILTDISGSEDHFGDMDLKISGTQNGIMAIQMDLKVAGVNEDTLTEAFNQARDARLIVLRSMLQAIGEPRTEVSRHAPRLLLVKIPEGKIGAVIGPGGRVIKKIQEETGAKVDIEDDGTVNIACRVAEGAEKARDMVRNLTQEPEVGKTYLGRVTGVKDFGAFVEILPGQDGLVHISELSDTYVEKVDAICKTGDEMLVKLLSIDDQGKIRLSRKAALNEPEA